MAIDNRFFSIDDSAPNWTTMYALALLECLAYDPIIAALVRWRNIVGATNSRILRADEKLLSNAIAVRDDEKAIVAISGTTNGQQLFAQIALAPAFWPIREGVKVSIFDFWAAVLIKDRIEAALQALPRGAQVVVVGHSLGGAIAMILTDLWLNSGRFTPRALVTFGQPRTGDDLFCAGITCPYVRIINGADVVPNIPPKITDLMLVQSIFKEQIGRILALSLVPHYSHAKEAWQISPTLGRQDDAGLTAVLRQANAVVRTAVESTSGVGFAPSHWMSNYKNLVAGLRGR